MKNSPLIILLKVAGWLLVTISITPFIISLFFFLNARHFVRTAGRAQGTVIKLTEKIQSDGLKFYSPVYLFQDAQGHYHEVKSSMTLSPTTFQSSSNTEVTSTSIEHSDSYTWIGSGPEQKLGDKTTILYNRDRPDDAMSDTFDDVWSNAATFGIWGFVFLLLGFGMFLVARILQGKLAKNRVRG